MQMSDKRPISRPPRLAVRQQMQLIAAVKRQQSLTVNPIVPQRIEFVQRKYPRHKVLPQNRVV
jgi:hypothetical protein